MNMMKIKKLTGNSWILSNEMENLGLVTMRDSKYNLMVGKENKQFETYEDLEKFFGCKIEEIKSTNKKLDSKIIDGYPIKHDEFFDKKVEKTKITYKNSETSKVRYAAGYWVIKVDRGYVCYISPKTETLDENEHMGPYKDRFEADHIAKIENDKWKK